MNIAGTLARAAVLGLGLGAAGAAQAIIVSIGGTGGTLGTGTDLTQGGTESALVQVYNERQRVTIAGGTVGPNYLNPDGALTGTDFPDIVLPGGTYDSHLLHYDPVGAAGDTGTISAVFTFSGRIVGLMTSTALLDASDPVFGLPSLTYSGPGDAGRRTEDTDTFVVSGNVLTVTRFRSTTGNIDDLRVITEAPEPATVALVALAGLALVRRRRRR